jgi:transposase
MDATLTSSLPDDVEMLRQLLRTRESQLQQRDGQLQQRTLELQQREAQLHEQQSTIAQLQRENEGLVHRLSLALRKIYGRSSERIDPEQLLLFGQAMRQAAQAMEAVADVQHASSASGIRHKGHGRRPLPADLPRHRVEHAVAAQELTCPCCDQPRVRIGEEVREQLDYTPASLFVIQHVRPKYACRRCEEGGVVTAEKPATGQVIDKGLPGPGLVAHVITSKYCDHQPLYRQESMLARHGVELARSTMCGWMKAAADLLAPLVLLMAQHIRRSKVIHTDDTPVPVQQESGQKTGKMKTGRLWVYLGDETSGGPYTVFDYTPDRSRDGPTAWLKNFRGYLQADAFGGYDGIYVKGDIIEVACWAHARRKFYDARHSDTHRAHQALALIQLLYDVERRSKDLDAERRLAMRQAHSRPLLGQLHAWMIEQREQVLPKSPMGTAISYALNNWDALVRYSSDGDLAIDNNMAERAIRPLVLGRKNYLHLGSDTGGRTAAILYSVIASAKRHGLDPFVYLRDVLATIGSMPTSQLDQFLPDRWRKQQLKEIAEG